MNQKIEIAFIFANEIPVKNVHKIEITFNFTKELPLKFLGGFKILGETRT